MSRRPKPIPGVETRTARNRRYRRLLRRLLYSSLELLVLFLLSATILGLTFSDPPALPTGEEDRKTFVAVVQLRMVIALMQLCGMSMHVIRVVSALESGNVVTVFNVCGNKYRMIVDLVFKSRRIYIKLILTHAEYNKNKWKATLCHPK